MLSNQVRKEWLPQREKARKRKREALKPTAGKNNNVGEAEDKEVTEAKKLKLEKALAAPLMPLFSEDEACALCLSRKKVAAFVHGKTAHLFTCYPCGDKVLKTSGRCPVCRQRAIRLVRLIAS